MPQRLATEVSISSKYLYATSSNRQIPISAIRDEYIPPRPLGIQKRASTKSSGRKQIFLNYDPQETSGPRIQCQSMEPWVTTSNPVSNRRSPFHSIGKEEADSFKREVKKKHSYKKSSSQSLLMCCFSGKSPQETPPQITSVSSNHRSKSDNTRVTTTQAQKGADSKAADYRNDNQRSNCMLQ